jgi:AcrR family transcriptional regulator
VGETVVTVADRRVRRTRKALRDALVTLMTEKGYESVTVQDIIDRADVGRSTFYTHFTDKDDLLRDNLAGLRSLLQRPVPTVVAGRRRPLLRFSLPLFRHVYAEQNMARALFGRPDGAPVVQQVEQLLIEVVGAELSMLSAGGPQGRVPQDAVVRFVVGAYLSLASWWLAGDEVLSPEAVDGMFQALVAPGVRAVFREPHRAG